MDRQEVYCVIEDEIRYAENKWDNMPGREGCDEDRSIEFWIAHMENYLDAARKACYGVDKSEAMVSIRKLAGLTVKCMMYHETPTRVISGEE